LTTVTRLGTRGSPLALRQTDQVAEALAAEGATPTIVAIRTTGDELAEVPLHRLETRDAFTRQLDHALLAGEVDAAVHSLKDIPTDLPDGLVIAAISRRADARDALLTRGVPWSGLPARAVVATCSLRRRAQLLHARPDLRMVDIRGNVATRLARLEATPAWDATVLAVAGLVRLGLSARITEALDPAVLLPAPGQGAIAVVARAEDPRTGALLRTAIHHGETAACVTAERALLHRLEGGCSAPVAALATPIDGGWSLKGRVLSLDGRHVVEATTTWPEGTESASAAAGAELAERLLAMGAREILASLREGRP